MSIEVSCHDCEMSYRLPDRYAGKRCRCRECGTRIRVPGKQADDTRKKRGKRAKAGAVGRTAQRTTRRLNSQEQDILSDRRALRTSERMDDGISESLHQLSPMTLSGTLDLESSLPSAPPSKSPRPRKRSKSKTPLEPAKRAKKSKGKQAKRKADKLEKKADKSEKKTNKKAEKKAKGEPKKAKKAKKAEKAEKAKKKPTAAKAPAAKGKAPTKVKAGKKGKDKKAQAELTKRGKGPRTKFEARRGRGRGRSDEEGTETQGRDPVRMAAVIAGTLCLLVGIALGMAIQSMDWGPSAEDEARETLKSKLAFVDGSIGNGKWDVAVTELKALADQLEGLNLPDERAELQSTLTDVTALADAAKIADPYDRLDAVKPFATHTNPRVRRGVVTLVRGLAKETDEVDLLAHMCKDPDEEVADIAKQGMIAVGGMLAIPYLHEAVRTSTNGSKLGDVALERALEIDAPEIVPVLITALEVRKNAPAPVLRAILEHLYEIGEPTCVPAAKALTSHDDASVRESAEKIVADLGE